MELSNEKPQDFAPANASRLGLIEGEEPPGGPLSFASYYHLESRASQTDRSGSDVDCFVAGPRIIPLRNGNGRKHI